jgi:hypothetical protein
MPSPPRLSRPPAPLAALVLAATAVGALPSCNADPPPNAHDDHYCEKLIRDPANIDAFAWFKDPFGGAKRLGSWSTEEGLAFAHRLEAHGAVRIVAVGVHRVEGPEAYETASALIVELPQEPSKRLELFKLYAKQVRSAGLAPQADNGQRYLYLPWES